MTPEECQMLASLFERINATGSTPRDAQAETFINNAVRAAPFAPYVLAQTVLIQQHALEAAAQRVSELEAVARPSARPQERSSFLGNLGKSFFGGAEASAPPRSNYDASTCQRGVVPPQRPAYPAPPPPQPQPPAAGPWGAPTGGGFLQNAMSTAVGVAGGVALGNLLGGWFGGRSGGELSGDGFGNAGLPAGGLAGGSETINNIYEDAPDRREADVGRFDAGQSAQDVNFDGLDDASFIDDSSYDDNGGGFDDV